MRSKGIAEFLAVAQGNSFTAAARSLGLSIPHVSRTVRVLEQELGVKLLNRTTRSVRLTDAGELLRTDCLRISRDLEHALDNVRSNHRALSGRIRLSCVSGSFADEVVAPALARFSAANPDVELDVDFDTRRVDLIREGYDAAIRAGDVTDRTFQIVPLASRKRAAAASPAYLERFGCPRRPADLARHTCIRTFSNNWTFTENGRRRDVEVRGRLRFNSGAAIRTACEHGLGIAYMAELGYGDALESGRLIPVLRPYWRADADISIVLPANAFVPGRLNALIECLASASRDHA